MTRRLLLLTLFVAALLAGAGTIAMTCLIVLTAALFDIGCSDLYVHGPKGNAIGDRHYDFLRVIAHAKTLQPGSYPRSHLPDALQLKGLLWVHVDARKAYALEFPSHPIDSNPIYIFVDAGVPDPEGVIRAMCQDHRVWHALKKLDEPGWYFVFGP